MVEIVILNYKKTNRNQAMKHRYSNMSGKKHKALLLNVRINEHVAFNSKSRYETITVITLNNFVDGVVD
jgi:hypothetical protein